MSTTTTLEGLEQAMTAADIAWWQLELPSGDVNFGKFKTDLLGYNAKNFKHYTDFTKYVHPEDYDKMMDDMRQHLEGRKDRYEALYRIKAKDGSYVTYYDRGKIVSKENGITKLVGIVINTSLISNFAYKITQETSI